MCVLSTLCGNVDKHSPFDIYIYIYIYITPQLIVWRYSKQQQALYPENLWQYAEALLLPW